MQGPFANVSRKGAYDANLGPWQNAIYNLARMWYFTDNSAYVQKAHDILIAWANTHTNFTGNESGLATTRAPAAAAAVPRIQILRNAKSERLTRCVAELKSNPT